MLALIILSLGISRSFSSPIIPILKSASELENEDGIIIQPIRNENIQPQLCVLSFPFNTTTGGKIYLFKFVPFLPIEAVHFLKTYFYTLQRSLFTMSKMDCHLLSQKFGQRISVMKTNTK